MDRGTFPWDSDVEGGLGGAGCGVSEDRGTCMAQVRLDSGRGNHLGPGDLQLGYKDIGSGFGDRGTFGTETIRPARPSQRDRGTWPDAYRAARQPGPA